MKKTNFSVYGYAAALFRNHNFDPDIAMLSAWYYLQLTDKPTPSHDQFLARMSRVKNLPVIGNALAEEMLDAYSAHKLK